MSYAFLNFDNVVNNFEKHSDLDLDLGIFLKGIIIIVGWHNSENSAYQEIVDKFLLIFFRDGMSR